MFTQTARERMIPTAMGKTNTSMQQSARNNSSFEHRRPLRTSRSSSSSSRRRNSSEGEDAVVDEVKTLLAIVNEDNRGIKSNKREKIEMVIAEILISEKRKKRRTSDRLLRNNAKWKLLWTSERETLFLLENFAASVAYQTIDVEKKTLSNAVEFRNGNAFVVDSVIEYSENEERVRFEFTKARFTFASGFEVPIPPFGKGWFDTVYVNDEIRIARDSRGDLLIVERCC